MAADKDTQRIDYIERLLKELEGDEDVLKLTFNPRQSARYVQLLQLLSLLRLARDN